MESVSISDRQTHFITPGDHSWAAARVRYTCRHVCRGPHKSCGAGNERILRGVSKIHPMSPHFALICPRRCPILVSPERSIRQTGSAVAGNRKAKRRTKISRIDPSTLATPHLFRRGHCLVLGGLVIMDIPHYGRHKGTAWPIRLKTTQGIFLKCGNTSLRRL
jgi:hypothetical protein